MNIGQETRVRLVAPCGWMLLVALEQISALQNVLSRGGSLNDTSKLDSLIIERNFLWGFHQVCYFRKELRRVPHSFGNSDVDQIGIHGNPLHRSLNYISKALSIMSVRKFTETNRNGREYIRISSDITPTVIGPGLQADRPVGQSQSSPCLSA